MLDLPGVRKRLQAFEFGPLFTQELGWDFPGPPIHVQVKQQPFTLSAVASKRGVQILLVEAAADGRIPDSVTRRAIHREARKSAAEHLLIFVDGKRTEQTWQWVAYRRDEPPAYREYTYRPATQTCDALIQQLRVISVPISEEESLDLTGAVTRLRDAFDREKVTKKFYDRFKAEHAAFLLFIKGIKAQGDLEWYTSLMLNRLMFVYFMQKKGFLDGDDNYLRNRMCQVRELKGRDKFQSFYRYFLVRLFHDGLGKHKDERKLDRELEKLLGRVPYLNGGFFEVHQLEERNTEIDIPDKAFEKLFDFFDEFSWHLDERPLRAGNEINPDVVGYIFEKYINQKQMGAYYTKEDITEYISKNTIIPFLFDAAQKKCPIAFRPESHLWRLLRDDPESYIHAAVRHGVLDGRGEVIPLPPAIEAGIDDVSKRGGWNRAAAEPFALPTETWREHVARRQRCLELRAKLYRGEVYVINDLITLNLDIWQFARDAILNSEGPELVRAFWQAIAGRMPEKSNEKFEPGVAVLDPTCGSGAFLFAALRILETLYGDCLQAMARFLDEHDAPSTPAEQLKSLIANGENGRCEFKSTMRYCIKTAQAPMPEDKRKEVLKTKDKERNHDVLKSVAAMLNTSGGDVIVGVQDDGSPYGLEADYLYFAKESERNPDGYELWLRQLFINHFGVLNSQNVRTEFVRLDSKQVLWLRVSPAQSASYVTTEGKQKVFYIRNGNETRALEIEEVVAYHQRRFSPEAIKALPGPAPESVARATKKKGGEDFRSVLDQIRVHPSQRYFILKSIIIGNLFGVDIMEEAVEICKLRLFLKLVAQVERAEQIEPLPDIDFNIRAGNTLVGYVSLAEIKKSQAGRLGFGASEIQRLEEDALAVEKCFEQFRAQQTTHGGKVTAKDKAELRERLAKLDGELDRYLAGEYGIDAQGKNAAAFDAWKTNHQPFHWFVEFYGTMSQGGFDVIVGNPPYVEKAKLGNKYAVRRYETAGCRDIYAWCVERAIRIHSATGRLGLIVPVSIASSENFTPLRKVLSSGDRQLWMSHFANRPGQLFAGAQSRLTIVIRAVGAESIQFSTRYHRWDARNGERDTLLATLQYVTVPKTICAFHGLFPKVGRPEAVEVLEKLMSKVTVNDALVSKSTFPIHWVRVPGYFCQFFLRPPMAKPESGGPARMRGEVNTIYCPDQATQRSLHSILNSSVYYQFFCAFTDGRHINPSDVKDFPCDFKRFLGTNTGARLVKLSEALEAKMREHTSYWKKSGLLIESVDSGMAKPIIDEIDVVLTEEYGMSTLALDHISNYDIKYRMGQDEPGVDE